MKANDFGGQKDATIPSTPGRQALSAMQDIHNDIMFKKPYMNPPRKGCKEKILDEGTYVKAIGKIIERDFFPDLEKLKAQNEYLEAIDRNDVTKMRQLYMKYSGNRPRTQRIPSPATFETPANLHGSRELPLTYTDAKNGDGSAHIPGQDFPKLSLDQFLNSHTSQDNQSFGEILEESDRKHREKYHYLYNEEGRSEAELAKQLALPSMEKQAALPEKKLNVDTWGYKNRNSIMFVPDGVPLTPQQEIELNKNRQEVVHSNSRLSINPFNEVQSKQTIDELAKTQAKVLDGKIGVDGKELVQGGSPKVQGFGFVRTPSPCPGGAETPLMTWGEIEGTPFRLDGSDTPLPRSQGPSFKMADPPRREQIALALAEKAGEKNRNERKQKALDAARRQLAPQSPRLATNAERLAIMSPAARRLASSHLKLGSGGFTTSYSASPSPCPRRRRPTPSPSLGITGQSNTMPPASSPTLTPTPKRTTPSTPNTKPLNLGIRRPQDDNLTDDLLKLPKRQKASDFF